MNIRTLTLISLLLLVSTVQADTMAIGNSHYQIGTGDLIRIQVYGEDDLTLETRITDAGTINYPFLGALKVIGKTPGQLQKIISDGLRGDYLIDPRVSVTIRDYRQYYVNGEVKKPGGFAFQPGLTVRKAISLAGGLTERASTSKIFIISESSPDRQNPANLDSRVQPGDTITIDQGFF